MLRGPEIPLVGPGGTPGRDVGTGKLLDQATVFLETASENAERFLS